MVTPAKRHGDIPQKLRERTVDKLRQAMDIPIATDVVARGLDVERITTVNYDIPYDTESYVHRIGRTGHCWSQGARPSCSWHRAIRMLRAISTQPVRPSSR